MELPPVLKNEKGEIRKVGFELEFGEVTVDEAVEIITRLYGGREVRRNKFWKDVVDTEIGDFTVKIDTTFLTDRPYLKLLDKLGIDASSISMGNKTLEENLDKVLEKISSVSIPNEIVTPPLPMDQMDRFENLKKALFESKAKGTKTSITYAFAVHINPELPALNVSCILNYIRAFLLLYPWMFRESEVDISRRISTFISPFPKAYIDLVLQPGYEPDLEDFINDYHKYNSDRNRPLDLYPVLSFLRDDLLKDLKGIGNVKSRPTFHYRLPNSKIDDPDWSLNSEWSCWLEVEKLADKPEKIRELSLEFLQMENQTVMGFENKWAEKIQEDFNC